MNSHPNRPTPQALVIRFHLLFLLALLFLISADSAFSTHLSAMKKNPTNNINEDLLPRAEIARARAKARRAQPQCGNVQLQLTPDYGFAIGSSSGGTGYTFALNGQPLAQGALTQRLLFHYDSSLNSTSGVTPLRTVGTSLVPGKFGSALAIAAGGIASYPAPGNLSFNDGTIELWFAPTKDGTDPIYSQYDHTLFRYLAANGDQLVISEATNGGFYAGITSPSGTGITAGGIRIENLKKGVWYHLALTYSKANGRLRLYLDGTLTNERTVPLTMPAADGASFTVNCDAFGHASAFLVDELRISADEKTAEQIRYDAARSTTLADNEILLPLTGVAPGQLSYAVSGCGSASYSWTGIPITNVNPGSNLLAPGSTSVNLTFNTAQASSCAYSVGTLKDYNQMTPFATGQGTIAHQGTVAGLSPDPRVLNTVFLRCNSVPDYVQTLEYRAVPAPSGSFPRIGSIWWGQVIYFTKPDQAKKIQLYLAPNFTAGQALAVRNLNPSVIIVNPDVNAVDTKSIPIYSTIPDDFYLKDTNGNRIEIWPGNPPSYRLNLTKPEVAEWKARLAFQELVQSHLAFDGIFFDNFNTSISWMKTDRFGRPIQIDANNDGQPDDPVALDAAWRNGVYSEIAQFRKLAPYAYVSGHLGENSPHPDTLAAFSGNSFIFSAPNVREGLMSFGSMWQNYQAWFGGKQAPITMMQASPPNQLAYGYGYSPAQGMPAATALFGQSFYPNVRFGLATSLMSDGYFTFDWGDNGSPANFWYDEYDFNLGLPLGPAVRLSADQSINANLLRNGGFENSLAGTWQLNIFNGGQGKATVTLDSTTAAEGNSSAHLNVTSISTASWHIGFEQGNLPLVAGTNYDVKFWARADAPRMITLNSQGGAPNFLNYGLFSQIAIDTNWKLYTASFRTPVTATDARLQFWVGDVAGDVWLDGITLSTTPLALYRRDFTHGVVLLNGTSDKQIFPLEPGLRRFTGAQAPLYQYIVDDAETSFSSSGAWNTVTYNTGSFFVDFGSTLPPMPQNANGPYYHAWQGKVHQLDVNSGTAQWNLNLPADGRYTIQVWLPAAPTANTWTKNAAYEIVSGGNVLASAMLDQTTAKDGDGWHTVATNLALSAAADPVLRVRNGAAAGALIADAVYVTSAALYNDGTPAAQVTLAPMDGILLQRQQAVARVAVVNAANYQATFASEAIVAGFGQNLATASGAAPGLPLPTSLFGTTVTVKDAVGVTRPAPLFFVSPGQVNYLIPTGTATGPATATITSGAGAVSMAIIQIDTVAPGLFSANANGQGVVAAVALRVKADGTQSYENVARFDHALNQFVSAPLDLGPSTEQVFLVAFGTGFRFASRLSNVSVKMADADAQVFYAGSQGGLSGVDQVNVLIPRSLVGKGQVGIVLSVDGRTANPVTLEIK
ncbi:MAG: carbohydrate binding domain-containing protein [Acidobacteria bacterium]|nr:carbohydrate binding domain-containing protein [Acidobacteriota bacterium]